MTNRILPAAITCCLVGALGTSQLAAATTPTPTAKHLDAPTSAPTTRPAKSARGGPAVAADLPSQDAIRMAFESGEYQKVIQAVARVLPLKPGTAAAADYDRYDLLTLRGESYLRLKQNKSAMDAFGLAAKEMKDDQKAATARAMQRTIREAKGTTVQRRTTTKATADLPSTADLLKPDDRPAAFRIVYDNLRESAAPKIKAASDAHTLPPIVDALTALADLDDLAQAGAGGDSDLASTRQELSDRGRKMITRELDRMEKDVAEIKKSAETVTEQRTQTTASLFGGGSSYDSYLSIRRGLTEKDRGELKDVISTCGRIIPATESLAKATSGNSKESDELKTRAKDVGRGAERVLDATYEGTGNKMPARRLMKP